mmetsp:Transcript_8162/g.27715  ORF Transcript_8162/g.27715 Transcript_8162/m.27715 type:complete len:269 (+) Transcript_8162:47-853(+)
MARAVLHQATGLALCWWLATAACALRLVPGRPALRSRLSTAARWPTAPETTALADLARALEHLASEALGPAMDELSQGAVRPVTPAFLELALSGDWEFVREYPSVAALPGASVLVDGDVRVTSVTSRYETAAPGYGDHALRVQWEAEELAGTLLVRANYTVSADGQLAFRRTGAELEIGTDVTTDAATAVMARLHAQLPPAVLDPDGCVKGVEYLDHEYMLAAYSGAKHRGHREVWRRPSAARSDNNGAAGEAAAESESVAEDCPPPA